MSSPWTNYRHPRVLLWGIAGLACAGYYWLRTQPFPHATPYGDERRLFGLGDVRLSLRESPGGDRWLLTFQRETPAPAPTPPGRKEEWPSWLYEHALLRLNARPRGSRPALTPVPFEGSWLLQDDALRYRWRVAGDWLGEGHLGAEVYEERYGPTGYWLLDLRSGRTYRGAPAEAIRRQIGEGAATETPYYPALDASGPEPIAPALDDLSPGVSGMGAVYRLPRGEAALHWAGDRDPSADLTAATVNEPYRSLVLAPKAALLAASADGRTLFIEKAEGLWRLDLRKPIAEMLREVKLPELPVESVLPAERR